MDTENRKNKLIAAIAAALFHIALVLCLVLSYLTYTYTEPPVDEMRPQEDITFLGGEYVMLGDAMNAADNQEQAEPAPEVAEEVPVAADNDLSNSGTAGEEPKRTVSSEKESPMKVEKKPEPTKKTGPTQEEIAEQERIKAEQEAKRKTNSKVKNAFGKSGSSNGGGKAGSPDGNSSTGARTGAPGVSGLTGYTIDRWGKPSSPVDGKIVIRVRVNSRGKVTEAKYYSGSGTAAANKSVRRSCEAASLQSSFKVREDVIATEAVGYITWTFEQGAGN